jgi:hypothetical protein
MLIMVAFSLGVCPVSIQLASESDQAHPFLIDLK